METALRRIIDHFLSEVSEADADEYGGLDLAEQEAVFLLEDCRFVDLVGRYDGSNSRDWEAHRRNFRTCYPPCPTAGLGTRCNQRSGRLTLYSWPMHFWPSGRNWDAKPLKRSDDLR